jgi:adrenodoxin-NADP+ reductase
MQDAFTTGDAIAQDWLSGASFLGSHKELSQAHGWEGVKEELGLDQARRVVTWDQWKMIDTVERSRGEAKGKEREKFTNVADMLAVLG